MRSLDPSFIFALPKAMVQVFFLQICDRHTRLFYKCDNSINFPYRYVLKKVNITHFD